MKTIYIAGQMKGNPDYLDDFNAAEAYLTYRGYAVLNPAMLPVGLLPEKYMPICLAMLEAADAVLVLKGGIGSDGATLERAYADYQGKLVYLRLEDVPGREAIS